MLGLKKKEPVVTHGFTFCTVTVSIHLAFLTAVPLRCQQLAEIACALDVMVLFIWTNA